MAQNDRAMTDEWRVLRALDVFHSLNLGCAETDVRHPGWTLVKGDNEFEPAALLFGQRPLVRIVAPYAQGGMARSGIAAVDASAVQPVAGVLSAYSPSDLFTPEGLLTLHHMLHDQFDTVTAFPEAHATLQYVSVSGFSAYVGQLQEWIERLDESTEADHAALSLVARFNGGVYTIRARGAIASYAGIHLRSPHVAEITVCTPIASMRGAGLGRAVLSRATRAALESGRVPLLRCPASQRSAIGMAEPLGYRPYAQSILYFAQA